jgi:hypothetical protein
MVHDRRVDVPWREHFARLEEVGLTTIDRSLASEVTPSELYEEELEEEEEEEEAEHGRPPGGGRP